MALIGFGQLEPSEIDPNHGSSGLGRQNSYQSSSLKGQRYNRQDRSQKIDFSSIPSSLTDQPINYNYHSPISQEEAEQLERYLKNLQAKGQQNLGQQMEESLINLSQSNARAYPNNNKFEKKEDSKDSVLEPRYSSNINSNSDLSRPSIPLKASSRIDIETRKFNQFEPVIRKGTVQDVSLSGRQNPIGVISHIKPNLLKHHASNLPYKKKIFFDPITQNCVTRSTPLTGTCEDHLIKRLAQDATEGRTVVDVNRRVCCALFWHKDCLNRIVVETCPDSSPAAADYLIGTARKLDLTLSCQWLNRDGCNGSRSLRAELQKEEGVIIIMIISINLILYLRLIHHVYITTN